MVGLPCFARFDPPYKRGRFICSLRGRAVDSLRVCQAGPTGARILGINAETGTIVAPLCGVAARPGKEAIVATVHPFEEEILASIRGLGLEWHVVFNKGSVMALPSGVTKATGLLPVLNDLHIHPEQVVGIGDAENDHAFLTVCGCAAAVANALPAVKERADLTTIKARGAGVIELIDRLLADDLADFGRAP